MNQDILISADVVDVRSPAISPDDDANSGGAAAVSWSAILAGAAGAAALSLILVILGTGLGLSSVSPFSGQGVGAAAFGVSTILWLTFTQLAASGMGGYLAGRLRSRWAATHSDEVYFRDTAHGFLAWAVASLATAAMLTSVIGSIVSSGAQASAAVAGGATTTAAVAASTVGASVKNDSSTESMGYFVDSLFRKDISAAPNPSASTLTSTHADDDVAGRTSSEVARIFAHGLREGSLSDVDSKHVGQVITQRTGISQPEAEKRAADTFARMQSRLKDAETPAKDAADKARKASSYAALWLFVSLLTGAFVASLAATYGGRRRDL
jgi:hypothetical protein